jgi:hypothetical protein
MSCNNVQILNFNHNIVEVGSDNKLIITDNVRCNSITIPQPITNILQINSPGPQGPGGFPYTGSAGITGSLVITGSLIISTSGSFVLPLTSSTSPAIGSAYWSGSFLFVYNGTRYMSSSFV